MKRIDLMPIEKMSRRVFLLCVLFTLTACSNGSSSSAESPNDQYLIDNSARENVVVTESGLQYEVLRASSGPTPSADSTITVNYIGELIDGTVFDSSYTRGEPATFELSGTIPGWIEGVQLMNVGSQFRFVLPPELAYGERGVQPAIAPDSILIFEVDLLEINSM